MPPNILKQYHYVSDSKIDMLYEQLDHGLRREVAHRLDLDAKIVQYSITISPEPVATRYARLAVVLDHLHRQGVGTIESPREYFAGNMLMRQGRYPRRHRGPLEVAFFVGKTEDQRFVALGGSAHHMVGSVGDRPWSNSGVASLMEALTTASLRREPPEDSAARLPGAWCAEVAEVWDTHPGPDQRLEFVAFKLARGADIHEVVLGSPLYVAAAHEPRMDIAAAPARRWWR